MSTMMVILIVTTVMFMLIAMILASILKTNRHILKSERDKTEIIEKSEIKYRTLVNTIEETIIVVDEHGKFKFFHSILPALEHFNSNEYIGKSIYDMFPKKTADVSMELIHDVIKTGHSRTDEIKIDIGKGNKIWINARLTPQFDNEGKVASVLGVVRDRTSRRAMEEQIIRSEDKYRALVESMEDTVCVLDKMGIIKFLNFTDETSEYLNSKEIIGKSIYDLIPQKKTTDYLRELINNVLKTGHSVIEERLVDLGTVDPFWVSARISPQTDKTGKIIAVLAVMRDITKRKIAEDQVMTSEKKYHSLIDSMEETVFVLDKKGDLQFFHTTLHGLKHLNSSENIGKSVYDVFPKEICDNLMPRVLNVFKTNQSRIDDVEANIGQGKKLWMSTRLTPQLNEAGQTDSVLALSSDISSRMETVDLLITSEEKYRTLVESMEESVIVLDKDGNYLFHQSPSPSVQHLNNEGYIGKSVYDSIPKKSADRLMANVRNVFSTKRSHFDENHIDRGKGYERWITYRVTPQLNSAGEVDSVLVISTDTTNRKILENDLKDSVKTLKSQQKTLQQLSREAINTQEKERQRISRELHDDIGQSLTAISLNLESINLDKRHEAKLKDRIKDSQKLVQKTIDDVHRFSYALRPPIIDDLGLIPALKSQAENFQKRTGIIVKIKGSKEVENTTSEIKTILYRVFQEGLNNIAKHSKASTARIVLRVEDHSISLEISDNGKGFDVKQVAHSSEKGNQGLQGIEERIKLVGGSLQVQSNVKSGTTLTVKAPYAEA